MPVELAQGWTDKATEPLGSAVKVGIATGLLGFCGGGAVGILKSAHPGIAAAYTGTQFFVLGSGFTFTRSALLASLPQSPTRQQELVFSTVAGTLSGAAAGRFWGPKSSIASAVVIGAAACLGQHRVHESEDAPHTPRDRRSFTERLAGSRFSPIKSLSNEAYEQMLQNKLIQVEAEINILDEKLAALRHMDSSRRDG